MKEKGVIFNTQRYSLHDGNGIRTVIFLKGCPLRCEWCSNPESQKHEQEKMFINIKCIGCGNCKRVCSSLPEGNIDSEYVASGEFAKVCPTNALKIVGKEMSVDQVIHEIKKDEMFYENSGGGVTVSGGEPLMQWEFASEILRKAKENYINTAVETSGYGKWQHLKAIADYSDTILYDLKNMDDQKHMRYIGVSNQIILENLMKLSQNGYNVTVRVPVIGEINSDFENINKMGDFVASVGFKNINLLPYHRYGENKYKQLGMEYRCKAYTPSDDQMKEIQLWLQIKGLNVTVGG